MYKDWSDRTREVFRLIVDEYLNTGAPIGSRTLSRRLEQALGVSLSPATIRNVMMDLEDLGLIASPHISAGRLPTDHGLRLYVDGLMQIGALSSDEKKIIESECHMSGRSMHDVYEKASSMLSGLSSCMAMVISPKMNKPVKHIQFLKIEPTKAIVILVLTDGLVENRMIDIPIDTTADMLQQAANYLNTKISGKTLQDVREDILLDIRQQQSQLDLLTASLVNQGLVVAIEPQFGGNIFVRGQSHLLSDLTALENLEQARLLLTSLEEEKNILSVLDSVSSGQGVQIFIGSENRFFDQPGWSSIFSPYRSDTGQIIGAIGVLGPSRLNYARIVAMVDYTSQMMSKIISRTDVENM
jgi:heat-inducible transcriptional repressor